MFSLPPACAHIAVVLMCDLSRTPALSQSDEDDCRATISAAGRTMGAARHWLPAGPYPNEGLEQTTPGELYGDHRTDYFNAVSNVVACCGTVESFRISSQRT